MRPPRAQEFLAGLFTLRRRENGPKYPRCTQPLPSYSSECLEGVFSDVRPDGVLRSSGKSSYALERSASVSLLIASTVSVIEASLESAPLAPASIARAATEVSRLAVNTSVGRGLPTPPSLISPTSSRPLP